VHALTVRSLVAGVPDRIADLALAAGYLLSGVAILYLVLFDQGTLAALVSTTAAHQNLFHEFFHDGRHLASAPCH
jgi:hypothetical protein